MRSSNGDLVGKAVQLVAEMDQRRRGLTVAEVAELLGCGRRHAYRWIASLVATALYEPRLDCAGVQHVQRQERRWCLPCRRMVWVRAGACPRCGRVLA